MRKQYHFRRSERGLLAWDVDRLVELSAGFTPIEVPTSEIRELDETFWFDAEGEAPTCRRVARHAKLINDTDLAHPVILSRDGRVMDGMHRVCKALIEGRETVLAVRFEIDPEPDHVNVTPDKLPYR
jgi:hypothetical protein